MASKVMPVECNWLLMFCLSTDRGGKSVECN